MKALTSTIDAVLDLARQAHMANLKANKLWDGPKCGNWLAEAIAYEKEAQTYLKRIQFILHSQIKEVDDANP